MWWNNYRDWYVGKGFEEDGLRLFLGPIPESWLRDNDSLDTHGTYHFLRNHLYFYLATVCSFVHSSFYQNASPDVGFTE